MLVPVPVSKAYPQHVPSRGGYPAGVPMDHVYGADPRLARRYRGHADPALSTMPHYIGLAPARGYGVAGTFESPSFDFGPAMQPSARNGNDAAPSAAAMAQHAMTGETISGSSLAISRPSIDWRRAQSAMQRVSASDSNGGFAHDATDTPPPGFLPPDEGEAGTTGEGKAALGPGGVLALAGVLGFAWWLFSKGK